MSEPIDPNGQFDPYAGPPDPGSGPSSQPPRPGPGQAPQHGPGGATTAGASARGRRLGERVGPRLWRRPEPRLGVALAGIGIGLTVFGIAVLGASGGGGGSGGGSDTSTAVGIVLSLVLVLTGYLVLFTRRSGPLANAGVASTALGVPVLMYFITDAADAGTSTTFNTLVLVSLAVWLVSYLIVPGAKGHVFYLGAFTVVLWVYVLDRIEPHILTGLALLPLGGLQVPIGSDRSGADFSFERYPDFNTVATVSIVIGVLYYAAAFALDRTGRSGPAVGFVLGGLPAMVFGLLVASVNAPQSVEGILLIVAGLLLGAAGATTLRRFTTWFWSLVVGIGIVVIIDDLVGNHDKRAGITLIVVGVFVVAAALGISGVLKEPDETLPTPPTGARRTSA